MFSRLLFAIFVPGSAAALVVVAAALLSYSRRFTGGRDLGVLVHLLTRGASATLGIYFVVLAIGPRTVWKWYSAGLNLDHRDLALAVAGISITAWSGCLIAFVVRQRLTPELSRGLRFLMYACFTPLVALAGGGLPLRTFALIVMIGALFWTALQFPNRKPTSKLEVNATSVAPAEASPRTPASTQTSYIVYFVRDRLNEVFRGWQWSALLAALAATIFAAASEVTVMLCSLLALATGMLLSFAALVVPGSTNTSAVL